MKFWIFLPFEINYVNSSKTIDEIRNILLDKTDKTLLFDAQKRYRGKFDELNIHLRDNNMNINNQHYYLSFLETNTNEDMIRIKIFSRNNMRSCFGYILGMIIGICGIISMIWKINFIGIIFTIIWTSLIFLFSLIHKKIRSDEVKYFKTILS
jgi:hypothetical protein